MDARRGWANADELRALGARCVRTVVDDFDRLDAALRSHPPDVRVIVSLTTEHLGGHDVLDLRAWSAAVQELARRFEGRIWAVECLSGWDRLDIEPSIAVACARRAGRILRDAGSEIACVLGSVGGHDWLGSLHAASRLLTASDREMLAGAGFQPYGKNVRGFPGFGHSRFDHAEIDVAVHNARDIIQLPIWATEFGIRLGQAGSESGQATYVRTAFDLLGGLPSDVLAAATYFCWWDPIGVPHDSGAYAYGLRRMTSTGGSQHGDGGSQRDGGPYGEPRLAWYAFADAMGGTGIPPAQFTPRTLQSCAPS
jgi:hypothetical protein